MGSEWSCTHRRCKTVHHPEYGWRGTVGDGQLDRFGTQRAKLRFDHFRVCTGPRVDALQGITGKSSPGGAGAQHDVELLRREVLELIYEYRAVVLMIEVGDLVDVQQPLGMAEQVVVMQLASREPLALDTGGERISGLVQRCLDFVVIAELALDLTE